MAYDPAIEEVLRQKMTAWIEDVRRTEANIMEMFGVMPEEACEPVRCWRPEYEDVE